MKSKYYIIISLIILATYLGFSEVSVRAVEGLQGITFPVEELGSCQSEADCKAYCDKPANKESCLNFAEKNGLMSSEEINVARKFLKNQIKGPGGCNSKETCENYCNTISHIEECVAFAEQNNLLPSEELKEFKKIQAALKRGIKPPACENRDACEAYCEEPSHMEECINFGMEAEFLDGNELEDAKKMLSAIKKGLTPPPCRGRESCEQYCATPENMEMCLNFAIEAGFMSGQEREDAQKMLNAIKSGVKPLMCKGKGECDRYCSLDENFEECFAFGQAAGFISPDEAEIAKKTRGKGPGGCKGKGGCESFCQNPENQQICFDFAKEHGLISEEEINRMEGGKEQFMQGFQQAPPEVLDCLNNKVGSDVLEKLKNGSMPTEAIGRQMQECFQMMGRPERPDQEYSGQERPGGPDSEYNCQSKEECEKLRMMQEERMRQEMMNRQEGTPQEYQKQYEDQYRQQYEQQYKEQYQQQTEPTPMFQPEKTDSETRSDTAPSEESIPTENSEPSGFLLNPNSILASLLYAVFDLLSK